MLLSQKYNSSKSGRQPGVSKAFGNFLQLNIKRTSRFCNLEKLLGRSVWFLELMLNDLRPVESPMDEGSTNISVPC